MKVHLKAFFLAGMVVCLLLCGLPNTGPTAMAQTNPTNGWVMVTYWCDECQAKHDVQYWSFTAYIPSYTGWDGRFTEEGRRFRHAVPPQGFPFNDGTNHQPPIQVTASMCDECYDEHYYGDEFTRSGSATCEYNCHGYATGKGCCPSNEEDGVWRILEDDYEAVTQEMEPFEGEGVFSDSFSHSVSVVYYTCNAPDPDDWGKLRARSEKNDASAIYSIDYYPDTGPTSGLPGILWREDWP